MSVIVFFGFEVFGVCVGFKVSGNFDLVLVVNCGLLISVVVVFISNCV